MSHRESWWYMRFKSLKDVVSKICSKTHINIMDVVFFLQTRNYQLNSQRKSKIENSWNISIGTLEKQNSLKTKVSCHLAWKTEVGTVPIGEFRITEVMQNGFQNMAFLSDPVGSWKVHTIYNPNSWAIFRNLMFHWYMHTFSEDVTSKAFLQKDNQKSLCWDQPPTSRDVEDSIFCSKLPYLFEIWWKNHHHRKSPKRIQPKKHTNLKWDSHDQPTNSSLPGSPKSCKISTLRMSKKPWSGWELDLEVVLFKRL